MNSTQMMSQLKRYEVWSNIFYLVPFCFSFFYSVFFHAASIAAVVIFGTRYHLANEKRGEWMDNKAAWVLIIINWVIIYLGGFKSPYFPIALLFLVLALYYHYIAENKQYGGYGLNHGMWHLYGALITLFALFTYIF